MARGPILITGGAGFLGAHLTAQFASAGVPVRLLDVTERPKWAGPEIQFVPGDVRDRQTVRAALLGVSGVVHAAFASPRQARETIRSVNVEGTRTVCAAAAGQGIGRLVLVSSTIVARPPRSHRIFSDSPLARLEAYRVSRIEAEAIAEASGAQGMSVAVVRPKTFLGPSRVSAFGVLFELIRQGRPVPLLGDGRNRYQLLDVRDLAEGIRLLAASDAGGVFAFGAREFGTVADDLQALFIHAQTGVRLRHVPPRLARVVLRGMELAGLVPLSEWHELSARGEDSIVDTTRAEEELDWRARRSNVQTLVDAYDWYVKAMATTGRAARTHPVPFAHRALARLTWIIPR